MVPMQGRLECIIGLWQTQKITCNSNVRLVLVLQQFLKHSHMLPMPDVTAFPKASHLVPGTLPIGGEVPYPSHTRFPSHTQMPSCTFPKPVPILFLVRFPSGAKSHTLPIQGSHPRPIEDPKPSHLARDGKALGLVWEECFVIVFQTSMRLLCTTTSVRHIDHTSEHVSVFRSYHLTETHLQNEPHVHHERLCYHLTAII